MEPQKYGHRDREIYQRGARKGKHQGHSQEPTARKQLQARKRLVPLGTEQRDGNHLQKKNAKISERAGLIKDTLGPAVDSAVEPDELRLIAGRGRELEVKIYTGEQSRKGGSPEEQADPVEALLLGGGEGTVADIQEDVNRDSEQDHARQAPGCDDESRIECGPAQAGGANGPQREQRQGQRVRTKAPFRKPEQADEESRTCNQKRS